MSYLPAPTMEALNTPEGRLIKQKMNEVLRELCYGEHDTWKFREREQAFYTSEGVDKYPLPKGHIISSYRYPQMVNLFTIGYTKVR